MSKVAPIALAPGFSIKKARVPASSTEVIGSISELRVIPDCRIELKVVPALGTSVIGPVVSAEAGAATNADATRAIPAPRARPFLVMFLDMYVSFLTWFAHNQLVTDLKRELPPTKQEIAHPYMYRVTDNMSVHYGLCAH